MKALLPELDAMVHAYEAGKTVQAYIPASKIEGGMVDPGTKLTITSSNRSGVGQVTTGRVVRWVALVEVVVPDEDAPTTVPAEQGELL